MNTEAGRARCRFRSALIKTEADRRQFVDTLVRFWRARISQALRHA